MSFSCRVPDLSPSRLATRLSRVSISYDLTDANPTHCGLDYPRQEIEASLEHAADYAPEALGLMAARRAVAAYASQRGAPIDARRVALTASTSEAYAHLFKTLCDPGETVAVPAPSYPLLDVLAELESVKVIRYPLMYDGDSWRVHIPGLEQALIQGARTVVVVQPNNPTGSWLEERERSAVRELCCTYRAVLIADEVFAPYGDQGQRVPTLGTADGPLTIVLDGLSKAAGLPQLKLSWMMVHGPDDLASLLLQRLEWIADAYLSVASPVQRALPRLLELAPGMQRQLSELTRANRVTLAAILDLDALTLLEGCGWHAVVRVPTTISDDELVLALAERAGVLVHPGYFYDFAGDGYLVISLLNRPHRFAQALKCARQVLGELFP
jgi:aspartate/methionine/tyrosine aminotransferase